MYFQSIRGPLMSLTVSSVGKWRNGTKNGTTGNHKLTCVCHTEYPVCPFTQKWNNELDIYVTLAYFQLSTIFCRQFSWPRKNRSNSRFFVSILEIVSRKPGQMTRNAMLPVVDLVMDDLDDVFVAENPEVTRIYRDQAGNIFRAWSNHLVNSKTITDILWRLKDRKHFLVQLFHTS